jgi:hypothetical protein
MQSSSILSHLENDILVAFENAVCDFVAGSIKDEKSLCKQIYEELEGSVKEISPSLFLSHKVPSQTFVSENNLFIFQKTQEGEEEPLIAVQVKSATITSYDENRQPEEVEEIKGNIDKYFKNLQLYSNQHGFKKGYFIHINKERGQYFTMYLDDNYRLKKEAEWMNNYFVDLSYFLELKKFYCYIFKSNSPIEIRI